MNVIKRLNTQEKILSDPKIFKSFFKNAPFPMMILDEYAEFTAVNRAAIMASGYKRKELMGQKLSILFRDLSPEIGALHFSDVIKKGTNFGEVPIKTKSGKIIYYNVFAVKINEHFVLGISIDITKEKLALDKLKRSEAKYRNYIENAPVGHFVMDSTGKFIDVNIEAGRQVNFPKEFLINKRAQDFFSPSDPNLGLEHMQRLFTEGKAEGDVLVRDADGKDHYYHMSGIKIEEDRYLLFSTETTELRLAKQKLQESNEKLKKTNGKLKKQKKELKEAKLKAEESDKLKSAFLANMSHEIRTPMNAIIGFSEILEEGNLSEEKTKKYLKIISRRSHDLLQIISDILDISKIEANQLTICNEVFCLNALLSEIYEFYLQDIANKQINVEFELKISLESSRSKIYTDPTRLKQVLCNLISNAIKFTENGKVEFGYSILNNDINFYVKDSGIGISYDQQKVIFERFHQAENETTKLYGGTGLGLSISKHLVDMLGGRIWVESEIGFGSCFYFTVPYTKRIFGNKLKININNKSRLKTNFKWIGKSILVIEDDMINQEFLNEVLKSCEVKLFFAETGKKGLEYINRKINLDLVLLDIFLPDIMGYSVAKEFKREVPNVPIIAQTAYALSGDENKCLEAGCDDYISKPIDVNSLLILINKYLS